MNEIWTAQEDGELLRLRRDGKQRMDVVAQTIGRPVDACYTRYYKLTSDVLQPKAPLSAAEQSRIETAFSCGYSAGDIATALGRGIGNVQYHMAALGLRRGLTKAWTEADDEIVLEVFGSEPDAGRALDVVCRRTGRLRGAVTSRWHVLLRRQEKASRKKSVACSRPAENTSSKRKPWIDRFSACDIGKVEAGASAGHDVKSVARDLNLTVDVVRRIAKLRGQTFSKVWSEAEVQILRDAAERCDTHAGVVASACPLLKGRESGAVMSKVKALRLVCSGPKRPSLPRQKREASARPVATLPIARQVEAPRQVAPARPSPRRQAGVAPGPADMARLTAEFLASGKAIARASSDTDVVTALRRRGYAVVGQDGGFKVDGRLTFADRHGLEKFAAERGVRC